MDVLIMNMEMHKAHEIEQTKKTHQKAHIGKLQQRNVQRAGVWINFLLFARSE